MYYGINFKNFNQNHEIAAFTTTTTTTTTFALIVTIFLFS